jgi:DNA-binding MarR family transcriptional regulator
MRPDERCLLAARQCTASQLRRATRVLGRLYDDVMAPSGLEGTQFSLLVRLSLTGEISMRALADGMGVDRTTLTRNLAPLERKGWVERAPGDDQRVRLVRITERGAKVLDKALPLWQEAQHRVVASLGKARWSDLLSLLKAVEALEP